MPCHNPTDKEIQDYYRARGKYGHLSSGELEAVLCGLLRSSKVTLDDIDWVQAGVQRRWVEQWWADHQRKDAEKES